MSKGLVSGIAAFERMATKSGSSANDAVDGSPLARGKLKFRIPLVEAAMCPAFDCGYVMRRWP